MLASSAETKRGQPRVSQPGVNLHRPTVLLPLRWVSFPAALPLRWVSLPSLLLMPPSLLCQWVGGDTVSKQ